MEPSKRELKIEVLQPDVLAFQIHRSRAPEGIEVGPLCSEQRNSLDFDNITFAFSVVIYLAAPIVAAAASDAAKEILKDAAKDWLVKLLANLKAKRQRINGREPKDEADLERIIREEIEIGKND